MSVSKRNSSGCTDLTAFHALTAVQREISAAKKTAHDKGYPRVYICSPFRGDVNVNITNAVRYARFALNREKFPIVPHLYLPQFMDDSNPAERALAIKLGLQLLAYCREVWVFGGTISAGMAAEIAEAKRRRISIKYFNTNMEESK